MKRNKKKKNGENSKTKKKNIKTKIIKKMLNA